MKKDILKIKKSLKKYPTESILIMLSIFITITSLFMLLMGSKEQDSNITVNAESSSNVKSTENSISKKIMVDVSGAISKPGLYELKSGSRINDAVQSAGGLSYYADTKYFYRNYNLSAYIYDQEKIYIPYSWEIESGIFVENPRILNYLSSVPSFQSVEPDQTKDKININSATIDELDELSGIGAVTAQKIIQGRPYTNIDDLISKKIVNNGVFENIKSDIVVN